ncbi:hypothetical protein RI129_011768 [Pyrocoelia pectoralis]|uniref:SZT2 n=1 Tax=Pyrocoelia pectoralis TaxID=417401 RepID=A0AAN7ZG57_9COLE
MEFESRTPDSDEGVELSPSANASSIELLGYALEEEKSVPLFSEAETVYILLPKDVPVSRAARFQWLLDHLNTVISVQTRLKLDVSSPNLEVISVVPKKGEAACTNKYLITTKTSVKYLAYSYRFVYCIDMSPSQSAVDIQKGEILFDEILQCIKATVQGLCRQFTVPGNSLVFQPSVYLTVIVNTPFFMSPAQQVLVEGVHITAKNLQEIVTLIESQFNFLEERIAQVSAIAHDEIDLQNNEHKGILGTVFYINECGQNVSNIPIVLPDVNFVNMLRYSMLAISLLPENSLSNILVITDGVVAMPDSNIMESLLMQLHYDSISVSFLKVGSSFHPQTSAGYISYTDLLHFISCATLGNCLEDFPFIKAEPSLVMNKYQELFLLWSFQNKINYDNILANQNRPIKSNEIFDKKFPILLCKRQTEENINASVDLLFSRRMREGYNVDSVNYNDNFLHVSLSLHWKTLIYIQYHMYYQWPLIKNMVRIEIHILAPYEFLHDITCVMRKELKSSYRQAVIERFWLRISQLSKGDSFLAQQLSVMPNSCIWYMLPDSVKSGIPVFILQGSDPTKLVLTPSDISSTKFISLWQSICQIETSNWRKWFHTYKLSVALKYDHPLPKHLHLANSSGRYQVIQCRQAASSLYGLLSEWASFVLIDNHTYLKLLCAEPDKPPSWFCLVRVTSKFPCAIVNLAFLTSTPGAIRRKICEELQCDLSLLSYLSSPIKSKENLCCTLLKKPLERVLIRYERIPTDFGTVVFPDGTQPAYTLRCFPPSPLASTLFTTLSRYLYHKRWIWSTSHLINPKLELPTVSRILSVLTRMRIKEGFNFAHSSSGIITMVLELPMEPSSTCMVQYVLFPPHRAWREGEFFSGSEEDVDPEMELESEIQMVTEVWVEPQYGTVTLSESQTNNHFNHKRYYELADVIYRLDSECISSLLTLEHLSLICQNKSCPPTYEIGKSKHRTNIASRYKRSANQTNLRNNYIELICDVKERILHVPFNFDPISILSLCQQTELLFSMFIESSDRIVALNQYDHEKSNRLLLETIHEHLQCLHDYEFDVTVEESERLMEQILSRHRSKFSHVCPISSKASNTSDLMLQWKCYIKGISKMHVILTFIPATLCSLKKLVSIEGTYTPSLNDSSESTERASSRGSNVSDVPINSASTLILPVYVFDCPLALLVESYINDVTQTFMVDRDVYEDHRFKFGFHIHEDSVRLKGDETTESRNYEIESNENRQSIKSHCKALVLAHSKCFVVSLFATLQHGFYVHTSDVHFAMDQCEETVHDIDISYYLQTICGHMKSGDVKQISVESLHQPLLCNELKPLHHLIKDRFSDIMNTAFTPIPSNRDFYYCRNLVMDKVGIKIDSDDEISIPPSDGVEFKSDKEASSSSETTSHFMRLDSTNSIFMNTLITPLFIHLICTVHYGSNVANTSVKVLPTCLGELIENIHSDVQFLEKSNLQITLDILCLTLPLDVLNVISDYSSKGTRTTSFCSDGYPSVASTTSDASFLAEFSDPLVHLPDLQKRAISSLKDKIKWLLKDEIATALLDVEDVTSETLHFVINHVTDNVGCPSCVLDCIDLNFVYGPLHSYDRFVQEFSNIKIPYYKLCREKDIYYLSKSIEHGISQVDKYAVTEFISENFLIDLCIGSAEKLHGTDSLSGKSEPLRIAEVSEDNSIRNEAFSQQSDTSSVNESYYGTDGGYDEDISEDEEDYSWLMRMDKKRKDLPNFWLIMCVDKELVKIYFHCRFLELPTTHVGVYLQVQRSVCDAIRDLCKRVNQSLLLQALNDTRNCHLLLEPDDDFKEWHNNASTPILTGNSSFSRLKSMDEASDESDPFPVPLIEASFKFSVGFFSCPVVWQTQFVLHPRLKAGYGKSGSSRGVPALKTVLDKLSVVNRTNMFVYQDVKSNVFYLRLHENVQSFCNKSVTRSNEFENAIVSRSPSIASLPLGPQKNNLTQSQHSIASSNSRESDIRPRVRSFGEKETKESLIEDTLILKVHGITEAGEDIRCDLVQVLQNRLDDAVLECLSVMLARNAMCPLSPEDVHFLQKPFRAPENVIKLSIQPYAIKYLNSFIHYLRQNLLQFLNIPKYSDNRSHYHFKDYSENDLSIKLSDNIFIYNQSQTPASGSRGIVCIALAIIPRSESPVLQNEIVFSELFDTLTFEELVRTNQYQDHEKPSSTYIEFRLWKQGRVNTDNLTYKLCAATKQSMWDIITEYYLLHSPLCEKDVHNVIDISKILHKTDTTSLTFSDKEVECQVVLNTNVLTHFKKKAKHNVESTSKVEETPKVLISQKHKRYIPLHSTARRSILFNDYIENTEHKGDEKRKVSVKFNNFELGNEGIMTKISSTILHKWLQFGVEILVPAVRKNVIILSNPHMISTIVQEVRNIIAQLCQETAKAFTLLPVNDANKDTEIYVRYCGSQLPAKVIIVSRNFEQWKACTTAVTVQEYYEMVNLQRQKHVQKFIPALTENTIFVPRQKFLWAIIQSNKISFYTYNWSKDSINKLVDMGRNVGLWLSTRAAVLSSITAQKLGIFYNQTLTRNYLLDTNNPYLNFIGDTEFMMKFSRDYSRRLPSTGIMQPMVTLEAFRDIYPHIQSCHSDPVVLFTIEMQEMKRNDKKYKDELKKLHSMWQSRTSTCTSMQIQILKQNSRIIHFCHTPLLFLQSWRVQSASTRDHALNSSSLNQSFGSDDSKSSTQESENVWHDNLCQLFIMEYKRYLQTFGFIPLQIEHIYKKRGFFKTEIVDPVFYVQKAMLGGILIFSIHLKEPFLITKLHAIECSRLHSNISRTSINQLLSFLDESDRIKIVMHLHSFTYDFHLRCIWNYISSKTSEDKVCEGYHLIHFLEDFMKYYNKAPNFARNLVHEETISVHDLSTESKQLYDYLLSNVNQYGMEVFSMQGDDGECTEYVLVQMGNIPQTSYKDSQDYQRTDEFNVTLIINRAYSEYELSDRILRLKYYLILTSHREVFPKLESDRNLGKFRAVSSMLRPPSSCGRESQVEDDSASSVGSQSSVAQSDLEKSESLSQNLQEDTSKKYTQHTAIKQESVNYLGYYSSHERMMQELILEQSSIGQKKIRDIVSQGMVDCRTHLLWNKLVSTPEATHLTYNEFIELKSHARLMNLSDIRPNLSSLLHQPLVWYQGLSKLLLMKYTDHHRMFISPDGNIQHYVILHHRYDGAFMLLSMDLHTSRGDLYAVYRTSSKHDDSDVCLSDRKALLDGFINCVCFYIWTSLL